MIGNKLNQKATESYSKSFSSKILEKSFPSTNAITGQQILDITAIKQVNFFLLKNLFLKWQEETKKFQSPFFDYSKPEVKDALKNLVNVLSKNILIKKDNFKLLLEAAVLETLTLMYNPSSFFIKEFSSLPNISRIQGFKGLSKYIKIHKGIYDQVVTKLNNDGNQVITDDEIKTLVKFVTSRSNVVEDLSTQEAGFSSVLELDIFEADEVIVEKKVTISEKLVVENEIILEIEEEDEQDEIGSIIIEQDEVGDIDQDIEADEGIVIETEEEDTPEEDTPEDNMDDDFVQIEINIKCLLDSLFILA